MPVKCNDMYYICKFSDTWSVYDTEKRTSRSMEPAEVNALKSLFPSLVDESRVLTALQVSSVNPSKLLHLSANGVQGVSKKFVGKPDLKSQSEKSS